jgi:hypothetical protein
MSATAAAITAVGESDSCGADSGHHDDANADDTGHAADDTGDVAGHGTGDMACDTGDRRDMGRTGGVTPDTAGNTDNATGDIGGSAFVHGDTDDMAAGKNAPLALRRPGC